MRQLCYSILSQKTRVFHCQNERGHTGDHKCGPWSWSWVGSKYEYYQLERSTSSNVSDLNELGGMGWEMCAFRHYNNQEIMYFIREII